LALTIYTTIPEQNAWYIECTEINERSS